MPSLSYTYGYVDLRADEESLWSAIETRTEIRKARKTGIRIETLSERKPEAATARCSEILRALLASELVPYSPVFDEIIKREDQTLMLAYKGAEIVSFISIAPKSRNPFFKGTRTAYLELSATDTFHKKDCPNYLLIWEAIRHLKKEKYDFFNLGLLTYKTCPDPDLERVAFFKRKWNILVRSETEQCSWPKYLYLRYFKRFRAIKRLMYLVKT